MNEQSASTSSVDLTKELPDKNKPEVRYCKNKKNDFENKVFDWITSADTKMPELDEKDEIDHALASMALKIRRDLNVRDRSQILFELQKYVHEFISIRIDQQQRQQQQQQHHQQQGGLMYAQEHNQAPESFMGMLQNI